MSPTPMSANSENFEALFESRLDQIDRAISWSCRRMCLTEADADDFKSWVHLRLIDEDYRIFRQFSGRSSLTTFLTTVIHNLARDFRTHKWGRWRPSAAAQRLGVEAIQLETLIHRDEFSVDEAIDVLRTNFGSRMKVAELRELWTLLPSRTKRPRPSAEALETIESGSKTSATLEGRQHDATLRKTERALESALANLALHDRLILKMHYFDGLPIARIATLLGIDQRKAYSRRNRSLRGLHKSLQKSGLDSRSVLSAAGWSESNFEFQFDQETEKHQPQSVS